MVLTCKREKEKSEAILCFWKPLKAQENQYVNLKLPGSLFCKTKKNAFLKLCIAEHKCYISTMKVWA